MALNKLPSVSVIIPTLNAEKYLGKCLSSIASQDYPKDLIEIIIGDGGSVDKTLIIAKSFGAKIFDNPLKTAESGKAVAFYQAKGELLVLIDSDNIRPNKNWLKLMIKPFSDKEVIGSEPWEFVYRPKDGFIDRYCALLGMNDPLCYFLGNYDRLSTLSGRWTEMKIVCNDRKDWLKLTLTSSNIPTIGANGTIFRRGFLKNGLTGNYIFDIDIVAAATSKNPVKFAKVKVGIIHLYCGADINKFIRKQKRRIRDFLYYQKSGIRKYPWLKRNKLGMLKFLFFCLTIVPLLCQTIKGYLKRKDSAWFFHPLACWLTFLIYCKEGLVGLFGTKKIERQNWKQ